MKPGNCQIAQFVNMAAAALLAGCAGGPIEIPKEILVQVPVACVSPKDRPTRPALLTDAEILALDTYRATWALWGDRLELLGHAARLEAVVEGCSRIPIIERGAP